jgi:hypothetical protein
MEEVRQWGHHVFAPVAVGERRVLAQADPVRICGALQARQAFDIEDSTS